MLRGLRRSLGSLLVVLIGVSVITFAMMHLAPGDPAQIIAGQEASQEDIDAIRRALRLDDPLAVQYFTYVGNVLRGDFGQSFQSGLPVAPAVLNSFGNTVQLVVASIVLALLLGISFGVMGAVSRGGIGETVSFLFSLVGLSIPTFFLGLALILIFAVYLPILPVSGSGTWRHLVMPALTLSLPTAAIFGRVVHAGLRGELEKQYVRTARSKGLLERRVVVVHALRNALVPLLTMLGIQIGYSLGGSVIVETLFGWPGLGRLIVQSVAARDFPMIQASVLLVAGCFVLINALVDYSYRILDPRIREEP